MEQPTTPRIDARSAIGSGFSSLWKPPFRPLLVIALFVSLVSNTLPVRGDQVALWTELILIVIGLYLQIAVTLAAADPNPTPSVDVWMKQAFARRCFWRYFATSILVVLAVVIGSIGLIVGGFIVGGMVALADPVVVLEQKGPVASIARSAELGRPVRGTLIVIFGLLVLIPGLSIQIGSLVWDLPTLSGPLWPVVAMAVVVLGLVATVALSRIFVALGGRVVATEPRESHFGRRA